MNRCLFWFLVLVALGVALMSLVLFLALAGVYLLVLLAFLVW